MGETEGAGQERLAPELVRLISRNAYLRQPNIARRKSEKARYRKGWELRLVLRDEAALAAAQRLVEDSGLKAGRPFIKHSRWVLPLYGRKTVDLLKAHVRRRRGRARS